MSKKRDKKYEKWGLGLLLASLASTVPLAAGFLICIWNETVGAVVVVASVIAAFSALVASLGLLIWDMLTEEE